MGAATEEKKKQGQENMATNGEENEIQPETKCKERENRRVEDGSPKRQRIGNRMRERELKEPAPDRARNETKWSSTTEK